MAKIQYRDFEQQAENGTITDFKPYIGISGKFREYIASKGQHINELMAYNEPAVITVLIKKGYVRDRYDEFKTHTDKRIREALAEQGLWPDEFIKDPNRDVRAAVVLAHPKYMKQVQNSNSEWYAVNHIVESDPSVSLEDLDFFLSLPKHNRDYKGLDSLEAIAKDERPDAELTTIRLAYRQKARALAQEMSVLEKTMTPVELYKSGNPAWVRGLSIAQIRNMNRLYRYADRYDVLDGFERHFNQLLATSHDFQAGYDVFCSFVA